MRHVPKIIQMQKILITIYGKKLTREEADKLFLQDCLEVFTTGKQNTVELF